MRVQRALMRVHSQSASHGGKHMPPNNRMKLTAPRNGRDGNGGVARPFRARPSASTGAAADPGCYAYQGAAYGDTGMKAWARRSFAAALISQTVAVPTEAFIRANYVKDDGPRYETGYARVGANRFRQAWVVDHQELSPFQPFYYRSVAGRRMHVEEDGKETPYVPSREFTIAVDRVIRCLPGLSPYRDELFAPERVRLHTGDDVITFYLYSLKDTVHSQPLFLSSFVLITEDRCASLPIVPKVIDVDRGDTTREVWDVFDFAGSHFVLAQVYDYEARGFALFRVGEGRLEQVLEFWFAYLGGSVTGMHNNQMQRTRSAMVSSRGPRR